MGTLSQFKCHDNLKSLLCAHELDKLSIQNNLILEESALSM